MKDEEYDILDELYFVTPYTVLAKETNLSKEDLKSHLVNLINKGFVKVYLSMDEEVEKSEIDMNERFENYYYLASKKGLFEHNSR